MTTGHGGKREGAGRPQGARSHAGGLARARLEKERALAGLRTLEWHRRRGELVEVDRVRSGMTSLGAAVREALQRLPDRLADELAAETNAHRVHSRLTVEIDQILANLVDELSKPIE